MQSAVRITARLSAAKRRSSGGQFVPPWLLLRMVQVVDCFVNYIFRTGGSSCGSSCEWRLGIANRIVNRVVNRVVNRIAEPSPQIRLWRFSLIARRRLGLLGGLLSGQLHLALPPSKPRQPLRASHFAPTEAFCSRLRNDVSASSSCCMSPWH